MILDAAFGSVKNLRYIQVDQVAILTELGR